MNEIPITQEWEHAVGLFGWCELTDEAKKRFEDVKVKGVDMVLAPAFLVKRQDKDGTIREVELKELSFIPAARAVKRTANRDDN
jgi:hypothetical protein